MTPGRLVVPVQPDGNYSDIEPVMKHSDVQRGIEPIYQAIQATRKSGLEVCATTVCQLGEPREVTAKRPCGAVIG
jgi:hypothetical protein